MMMPHLLAAVLGLITICHAETASNGPLVYPSWPPKSSSQKPFLHSHIQSPAQQRHQMVYPMRPSSGSTRYASALVQSPSNIVYSPAKQRTYQPHMMIMQQQQPLNRVVMRPSSQKMSSSISGMHLPSLMTSAHHPHHMSSTATHPIFFKKPQMTSSAVMKSNFGATSSHKNGDYVFENPFATNTGGIGSMPTTSALTSSFSLHPKPLRGTPSTVTHFTSNLHQELLSKPHEPQKSSPIHTINAPNLSLHEHKPFADFIQASIDTNYILEKDPSIPNYSHIAFTPQRPSFQVHQYQVTEPTNDFSMRDSHIAKQTAPNPHSPLPSYQIKSVSDPFITSGNQFGHQPAASALVQQHIYPASTNLQHIHAQPSHSQHSQIHLKQPVYEQPPDMQSAYNPTYLVTQSNQLFSQHKQHLFKPDPVFLQHSLQQPSSRPEFEFIPSYQLQPIQSDHQQEPPQQPLDEPQFAQLIGAAQPTQHQQPAIIHPAPQSAHSQRQSLTENEVSNLMNFGRLDGAASKKNNANSQGFIASTFFKTGPSDTSFDTLLHADPSSEDVFRHQQRNDERIVESTRQALFSEHKQFKQKKTESNGKETIFVTKSPEQKKHDSTESVYPPKHQQQQHQRDHGNSDLRIYVPDTPEQNDTFQKRSDDFASDETVADDEVKPSMAAHDVDDPIAGESITETLTSATLQSTVSYDVSEGVTTSS